MMQVREAKEDRRVQRTRQLLRDALVAEILEKGYEAVTVQDILDRANLGRSTFYAHYRDKEDLLLSGFERFHAMFEAQTPTGSAEMEDVLGPGGDFSLALFYHVAEFRAVGKAMLGKQSGNVVFDRMRAQLVTYLRERLARQTRRGYMAAVPQVVVIEFLARSLLGLVSWWIDEDLPYTPEEMDEMFKRLVLPGLRSVLVR